LTFIDLPTCITFFLALTVIKAEKNVLDKTAGRVSFYKFKK